MSAQPVCTLGDRIRAHRSALGLSQRQLAERIGVFHTAVAQWERGANNPTVARLPVIAEALGTTVAALMADDDKEAA